MKIILASTSPRRIEILKNLGLKFKVVESGVEEDYPSNLSLEKVPEYLAEKKASKVFEKLGEPKNTVVIGADTIVLKDGKLIGKPKDKKHAFEILRFLSGDSHFVITGICIVTEDKKIIKSTKTKVYFRKLTEEEIWAYIKKEKNILDKAGAYGIQDFGRVLVERIEGDFYNVVGLPVVLLMEMLREVGVKVL